MLSSNACLACLLTGGWCPSPDADLWEPDDGRLSRPVLREPGGEIPPGYLPHGPSCSAEGYRIVWFCSSTKRITNASSRIDRIERARAGLSELATSLSSPRCRLKSRLAAEDAVKKVVAGVKAVRWVRYEVIDEVATEFRQERRGRPGKDTRYKKVETHRFSLSFSTDADAVAFDAASDGCFPMISNDTEMTAAELLDAY